MIFVKNIGSAVFHFDSGRSMADVPTMSENFRSAGVCPVSPILIESDLSGGMRFHLLYFFRRFS